MAQAAQESPKGLTLSQVSELLGASSRSIQYLRERQVVVPSVVGHGRGGTCYYSFDDVIRLSVILPINGILSNKGKKEVLRLLDATGRATLPGGAELAIDLPRLRSRLRERYNALIV